ncbi:DUF975 family protein [Sedimentibacter sp. zth1]|uniref:DUF975 family protein n=1 Tax=Sedimentibacter sp. zth1 TaxID=2816908 RepID=UPI001A91F80E|nr:DUF975 family protein [Sedimentibacter sp. zth1]QSX06525.1 DUF975 family protein [Sedimentibacter sp. zth1]
MYSRLELKEHAQFSIKNSMTSPILNTILYFVIVIAISVINNLFMRSGGLTVSIIGIAISLFLGVLDISYKWYCLTISRDTHTTTSDMFKGLNEFFKVLRLEIAIGFFVLLWELIAIVPIIMIIYNSFDSSISYYFGSQFFMYLVITILSVPAIIASIRYSQAIFILADNNIGILEAINKSKKMMKKHIWEYFILNLSFVLWYILVCITFGLASIYVYPYYNITLATYYDELELDYQNENGKDFY